jgi:hypothetical protein
LTALEHRLRMGIGPRIRASEFRWRSLSILIGNGAEPDVGSHLDVTAVHMRAAFGALVGLHGFILSPAKWRASAVWPPK